MLGKHRRPAAAPPDWRAIGPPSSDGVAFVPGSERQPKRGPTDAHADAAPALLMTMALAVALVACSGAVGKTGETGEPGPAGPPGEPPEPVNLAPIARAATFDAEMLREDGEAVTIDAAVNFVDPEKEALDLTASVDPTGVVTIDLADDGVLTVTPVAPGEAVITVTATDPGKKSVSATLKVTVVDAGAPMYDGSLIKETALEFGDQEVIAGTAIESAFDGENLTFSAAPSDPTIVLVTKADDNTVTITALSKRGDTTVTITATDEDDESVPAEIKVSVRETLDPTVNDMTPAEVTLGLGGTPATVDASMYFTDPMVGALMYAATVEGDAATASADPSTGMVTITPEAVGMATVTVTASNDHDSAMQTISVTVNGTPPTAKGEIPDVSLTVDGSRTVELAGYFEAGAGGGPITSYAPSVDGSAATARVIGDTLIINAVSAGSATITVTATDAEMESVPQEITVTVTAEEVVEPPTPNMPPQVKKTLPNLRIQIVTTPADTTDAGYNPNGDTSVADTADNEDINLSEHFEDLDGVLLFYKVEKKPGTETLDNTALTVADNPVIDLHRTAAAPTATTPAAAKGAPPNFELNVTTVTIEPLRPGSVTVLVTAKDVDGATTTAEFMITVVAAGTNADPGNGSVDTGIAFPDLTGDSFITKTQTSSNETTLRRLTIGETRKVIDGRLMSDLFSDSNLNSPDRRDERLRLFVKYFPLSDDVDGTATAIDEDRAAMSDTKTLAAEKVRVTHKLSADTWDGSSTAKLTFSLTAGTKGTDNTNATADNHGHLVALIATDAYGKSVAHVLRVIVNNPPVAHSAHEKEKDQKELADYKEFLNLDASITDAIPGPEGLPLVPSGNTGDGALQGYFSDIDFGEGSTLECEFRTSEANKLDAEKLFDEVAIDTTNEGLSFRSNGRLGTGSITVWCEDKYEAISPEATVPVSFTKGVSIHQ